MLPKQVLSPKLLPQRESLETGWEGAEEPVAVDEDEVRVEVDNVLRDDEAIPEFTQEPNADWQPVLQYESDLPQYLRNVRPI